MLPDAPQILSVFPTTRTLSLKTTCPDRKVTWTPATVQPRSPFRLLRLSQGCPLVIQPRIRHGLQSTHLLILLRSGAASQFWPVGRLWASYISGCPSIWAARWLESGYASLAERPQSAAGFSVCPAGGGDATMSHAGSAAFITDSGVNASFSPVKPPFSPL